MLRKKYRKETHQNIASRYLYVVGLQVSLFSFPRFSLSPNYSIMSMIHFFGQEKFFKFI